MVDCSCSSDKVGKTLISRRYGILLRSKQSMIVFHNDVDASSNHVETKSAWPNSVLTDRESRDIPQEKSVRRLAAQQVSKVEVLGLSVMSEWCYMGGSLHIWALQ